MAIVMVMRTVLTTVTIIHLRTKYDLRLSSIYYLRNGTVSTIFVDCTISVQYLQSTPCEYSSPCRARATEVCVTRTKTELTAL